MLSSCDADDGGVVFLAFGAFALVVGAGVRVVLGRDECLKKHRVLEAVLAATVLEGAVDDLGEGPCSGPGSEPTGCHQDLAERMRQERFFDLVGETVALVLDPLDVVEQFADDLAPCLGGRYRQRLGVECRPDLVGDLGSDARRTLLDQVVDLGLVGSV